MLAHLQVQANTYKQSMFLGRNVQHQTGLISTTAGSYTLVEFR